MGKFSNWMGKYMIRFIIHMQIKFLTIYRLNAKKQKVNCQQTHTFQVYVKEY